METEKTETEVVAEKDEGEGNEVETVSVPKKDYDTLNQTIGSLKRELKDLRKAKEESKETPKNQSEENVLLQRLEKVALRQAGLTHTDDIELARSTAKKWNMELEEVLVDDDFKAKLERQQTARSNAVAASNIKGGQSTSQVKNSKEYWISKGVAPSRDDVPNRKLRAEIALALHDKARTSGKTFYND